MMRRTVSDTPVALLSPAAAVAEAAAAAALGFGPGG